MTWHWHDRWESCDVVLKSDSFREIQLSEPLRFWVLWEISSCFCSKTQWQMFLLVSGRHVGAHLDGHQHGVSIQISINLGKMFFRISSIRKIAVAWILARVFVYLLLSFPRFWTKSIERFRFFYFDLLWMAWHWKPAIVQIKVLFSFFFILYFFAFPFFLFSSFSLQLLTFYWACFQSKNSQESIIRMGNS